MAGRAAFEFATANRIIFGKGKLAEVVPAVKALGRCALVVTGKTVDRAQPLLDLLTDIECVTHTIPGEPNIADAQTGVDAAVDCEFIIAMGGGSAIDAGKAIAALCSNPGNPLDYLEVIGKGKPLTRPPLPFIAIPTTAGTGAEVTRNAVLSSSDHKVKVSLRHPLMLPQLAIVDPELTHGLPPAITAATGMDTITQLIEPFTCRRANPFTDAICREAIPRACHALRRAFTGEEAAREDMAYASLSGGLALANSGLGAVHGFAAPIGGMFDAPHGAVCAALLPHSFAINAKQAPKRFGEVTKLLGADDGATWLRELASDLQIPGLSTYGITEKDFPAIIDKARHASSMKANPVNLTDDELTEILRTAL
ncbi:MAG: iron-containing alcohol dehydrogenase [Verrucomicrobiota bacterium]|jgi:alcohol dehydrogenase class IV|nr:iron-containing alcohol dehydrogenase [Verrucomicrobiota bacterium]